MALRLPLIFVITLSACHFTLQSPSPYSLQPAVEALSEREAQIALRDELQNENLDNFIDNDDFDDYGAGRGQHNPPNNALERYFSRASPDYDDYLGYRKRALFRKRGTSVFRERSRLPSQHPQQQAQLAEKFLKAIGDEREREREDEYREELHKLWNRYQKEESGIERELFNDNDIESDYPIINYDENDKKKKRQRGEVEVAPGYWNDEKRSMPLLPWLPASRKKRFPVTKRSPKATENELVKASAAAIIENDEKIAQDLRGIFGAVNDDVKDTKKKKKRSMEETVHDKNNRKEAVLEANPQQQHSSMMMMAPHHSHVSDDKKRNLKKRSSTPDDENEENDEENENEEGGDDGQEEEEVDENDSNEEDKKKKKKKREAAKKSLEVVGAESFPEKKGVIKKKSVEWSSLFGLDRKKKSLANFKNDYDDGDYENPEDDYEDEQRRKRKRSGQGLIFHPLQEIANERLKKKECEPWWMCETSDLEPEGLTNYDIDKRKKKRTRGDDRLDAMDQKLNAMKNLIIEDTARYFSHHDENLNPSETKNMRSELADRLATAYSLDKMRKAIARLKQSMAVQRALEKNLLESPVSSVGDEDEDDKKKAKRVAVKKEKVEFDNNGHEIDSPTKKVSNGDKNDLSDDVNDEEEKKNKKRSQKKSNIVTNEVNDDELAPMSEGYMGGKVFQNECPLFNAIEKRCRGIDLLTGDTHHNLLQACGAHQLCYLCGDSETQCDYGYLYEIQDTCGHNVKCKLNGAQALKALRSFSGTKVGPRECIRNRCLNSALRSLGY